MGFLQRSGKASWVWWYRQQWTRRKEKTGVPLESGMSATSWFVQSRKIQGRRGWGPATDLEFTWCKWDFNPACTCGFNFLLFLRFSVYLLLLILASRTELWLWLKMCILEKLESQGNKKKLLAHSYHHLPLGWVCSMLLVSPKTGADFFWVIRLYFFFFKLCHFFLFSCSSEKCLDFILTSHFPVAVSK